MNCDLDIENVVEVEMIREVLRKENDILLLFFDEIILNWKCIKVAELNEYMEDLCSSSSDDEEKWE
tara:strand:+ start:329 stop:526 length:198 start_codon:yes stop_codon:yes gene_type:complete